MRIPDSLKKSKIVLSLGLALLMFLPAGLVMAQGIPEEQIPRLEQARRLEREISAIEEQYARAMRDWATVSEMLTDIENKILDCYHEIDAAEAEVESARRSLNSRLRLLYMEGRHDALVEILGSKDISEFLTRYDYILHTAKREADAFNQLKDKRDRLRGAQERLIASKREAALLARTADTATIETLLNQKRKELAELTGSLIANQLPGKLSPLQPEFQPNRVYSRPDESGFVRTGQYFSGYSSWYGNEFNGHPTASGERFDQYEFTGAHRTLPLGTWLRVTFRGRSVVVKVNDRGPFVKGRALDLSRGAAEAIGLTGVQWVDCEIVVPRS